MELPQMILRAVQFLWTLLLTALIGNVISTNINGHMAAINFTMFVAVLSWLSLIYGLVASFVSSIAVPMALIALDGLALLFAFIDGIVLAAMLKAVKCGGDLRHSQPSSWIGFGSHNDTKRCREIQASTAFVWFLFATVAASLALALMSFRRMGGSVRSSGPGMSQVNV